MDLLKTTVYLTAIMVVACPLIGGIMVVFFDVHWGVMQLVKLIECPIGIVFVTAVLLLHRRRSTNGVAVQDLRQDDDAQEHAQRDDCKAGSN